MIPKVVNIATMLIDSSRSAFGMRVSSTRLTNTFTYMTPPSKPTQSMRENCAHTPSTWVPEYQRTP